MQPSPTADTSKLLFPSLRFCIVSSRWVIRAGIVVTDLFHPVDGLAVEPFLNGDIPHCRRGRCAMPMFLTRRKPDHVARPDFLYRAAPTLHPSETGRDDQHLTEWMRMPGGPGTRFERDAGASNTCWFEAGQ
jgi:hypothetical protein